MGWLMRRWRRWRLRRHRARLAAFDAGGNFSGDMRQWCLGRIAWHEALLTAELPRARNVACPDCGKSLAKTLAPGLRKHRCP